MEKLNIYHRQNTGCKDINGKFIHEGDVVRCKLDFWVKGDIKKIKYSEDDIGKIIYSPKIASYLIELPAPLPPYTHQEYFERYIIEIIGNIDDNPNLFKNGTGLN